MKAAAESAVRLHVAASGPRWTIVRSTAFADMWLDLFRSTAGRSGVPKVLGPGRNAVNFVAASDVAVAVARAVTDPSLRGRIIEVAGEDLSETDLAALVTEPGKRPAHIPTPVVWTIGQVMRPFRPSLARVARQTLVMERIPMGSDPGPAHAEYPWLPLTPISAVARRGRVGLTGCRICLTSYMSYPGGRASALPPPDRRTHPRRPPTQGDDPVGSRRAA